MFRILLLSETLPSREYQPLSVSSRKGRKYGWDLVRFEIQRLVARRRLNMKGKSSNRHSNVSETRWRSQEEGSAPEVKKHGGQGAASSSTDAGKKHVAEDGGGLDADRQIGEAPAISGRREEALPILEG
jgi:hypothetical protein